MSSPGALPVDTDAVEGQLMYLFGIWEGTTALLLATSSVAVALRLWVRGGVTKTFGWDDAVMATAQVCWIVCAALSFVACQAFIQIVGTKNQVMTIENLLSTIRLSNAFYSLTMLFVKLSVAIFFLKLFGSSHRWQRYLIIILAAGSAAIGIAYLIFTLASCGIMIQSQKTTPYKTGTDWCPVQQIFVNFSIAWSVFNAITDIVYAALAIGIVWRAQMARSTKVSAAILICLGSVGGAASIARIFTQLPVTDVRLSGVLLTIWSNVEAGVCITAASLIVLRPLIQVFVEKTRSLGSSLRSSVSGGSGSSTRKDSVGSFGSKTMFGSKKSKLSSTTSSQNDIAEIVDLEERGKLNASSVVVTKTWHIEEKDDDLYPSGGQRASLHPAYLDSRC